MILNNIRIRYFTFLILNLLFQAITFAQVDWEDAAFGGGPHESGGDLGLINMIFLIMGIVFFIWFLFFND